MHVLFDLNGTLLDPELLGPRVLDLAVEQAMVDTLTGAFHPFLSYVEGALSALGADDAVLAAKLDLARALPPAAGAREAIDRVRDAGHEVGVVTNSAGEAARASLDAAGFPDVPVVLGADAVHAYKPDPRVYDAAARALAAELDQLWLVTAHWWDVAGAERAGWHTVWVASGDGVLPSLVPTPDARARDLPDAVARVVAAAAR